MLILYHYIILSSIIEKCVCILYNGIYKRRNAMIIFEKQGVITPAQDKTNLSFEFEVPRGVSALFIDFSYSPKTLDDEEAAVSAVSAALEKYLGKDNGKDPHDFLPVNNLVTLSADDPLGYRGVAHRQPNEQHIVLAEESSTPGFLNREVFSGKWRIMLNVHCCVCEAHYRLKISGGDEK